jgi:hypothetical protein
MATPFNLMVPSQESCVQTMLLVSFGVVGLILQSVHLNAKSGFRDRGLCVSEEGGADAVLKTRAIEVLTQGLELGPVLGELLRETVLGRNGAGPSGLLVLRVGWSRDVRLCAFGLAPHERLQGNGTAIGREKVRVGVRRSKWPRGRFRATT